MLLRPARASPPIAGILASRGNRQMVVIGYSDTNKEGGIAASRWALQLAQTRLLEAARGAGIQLLIFHGRGGTPARGGGRTEHLVESMPDGAVRGVLRLTEQGEVVNQSYGLRPIAMRTLERTFASVALATAHGAGPPDRAGYMPRPCSPSRRAASRLIANLVFGSPQFPEYFRAATPLDVIERMHIAVASGGACGRRRDRRAAGNSLGICLDAKPPHVAGLVRLRQRTCRQPWICTARKSSAA